ncbi:MAG: MBL fold metallo-hydrolase [Candidatus Lokiarchaeota archaeon]|nr:MBL fold metallo-hydrolase [Candidatus Lokiarchaeota archaeon]
MTFEFTSEINRIVDVIQIKIDVPFDVKYVYVYLFKIGEKYILFDAGLNMGNWAKQFFNALDRVKILPENISHCFISHNHLDHIGLIRKIRRKNKKIKIVMHEITDETMRWETNPDNLTKLRKEVKNLARKSIEYGISEEQGKKLIKYFLTWPKMKRYRKPDILVSDGDTITVENEELEIIWTPGHSLGHICVYEKNRSYLFSGDHILSRITPHIGNFIISPSIREKYNTFDFENILHLYLSSLDRISSLKPKIIFPAHQEVIKKPQKRILEIKEHHNQRLKEILNLIKDKPMAPYEISKIHFGELDDVNSFLALSEVLGHLIFLERQNIVSKQKINGKILFKAEKEIFD